MNAMNQPVSQKISRNTIFNTIGRFWALIIGLALVPYIISYIGVERFGIWALIGVLTGYFGLLDFGIGASYEKYISEYYTKEDYKGLNRIVNTGFIFHLFVALLICAVAFVLMDPIIGFLNVSEELHQETEFVFKLGIIIFALSNAFSAFGAIQRGLQRMDISNKIAIAMTIPMAGGVVFFLESGYGLPGLMINNAIIFAFTLIVNLIIAFRLLPSLRFNPLLFNRTTFKKLFNFGVQVQVARVEDVFTFQTDKLLISHFLGVGLVTFYQLGSSIVNYTRELPLLLTSAIVPAASEIDAKRDKKGLFDLYFRGTKYLAIVGIPLLSLSFLTAPLIMLVWMGPGYEKSAWVIMILAPCYIINILTGMGTATALGVGKPGYQMKAGAFQLILNIILSIVLVLKIGFIGVVIATLVSLSLGSSWFMFMFHRDILKYSLIRFAREIFSLPLLACLLPAVIIGVANYFFIDFPSGRLPNLGILTVEAITFISLYIPAIWKTSYFDEYDKTLFANAAYSIKGTEKIIKLARGKLGSQTAPSDPPTQRRSQYRTKK